MEDQIKIANRFKTVRKTLKLTQKQLAEKINASITSICEIENGKHKPNCDCLENLSRVFDVNLYWLLFGEGEMFLDPAFLLMNQAGVSVDREIKKFWWYFHRSAIIRHSTLANFCRLLIQNKEPIEKETNGEDNPSAG